MFVVVVSGCGTPFGDAANLDSQGTAIIFFGDSITHGYGVSAGRDFPYLVGQMLGTAVINAGRNGDTTATALARIEKDVLSRDPRVVVVELGGNDFLRKVRRETTFQNLDKIVSLCVERGAMVVLVHAKFGLLDDPYLDGDKEIAKRHGAVLVKNVLKGVLGRPSRMVDMIHPNEEGHAIVAERIFEVLGPLLAAADGS